MIIIDISIDDAQIDRLSSLVFSFFSNRNFQDDGDDGDDDWSDVRIRMK